MSDKDKADKAEGKDQAEDTRPLVEREPDLDPNEPGIDEVERNRRREELTRRQG